MKSPPVEDMFAELDSEDGDDYVVPRRTKPRTYYTRQQLLALKESPLVQMPVGMSPSSEWFTPPSNDTNAVSYRSRQPAFPGDSLKDFALASIKGPKRGLNRGLAEHNDDDTNRPFGRGLVSSGRPRNPTRRTDSGAVTRNLNTSEEILEQSTQDRRPVDKNERSERSDRKERSWLRGEGKDQSDIDSLLMGRFATLKLQAGEEADKRTIRPQDMRSGKEASRNLDPGLRKSSESTWRRTASGNVERTPSTHLRRYGMHEEEHVPEWMTEEVPSVADMTPGRHNQSNTAYEGLDEIAAYRQSMKEREEKLNNSLNLSGRTTLGLAEEEDKHTGIPLDSTFARIPESNLGDKAHVASFLLPQAKTKNRTESDLAVVTNPTTPGGKGSRFARFFDPTASPAISHNVVSPSKHSRPSTLPAAMPEQRDTIADKTQDLAALLGIRPASLNRMESPLTQRPNRSTEQPSLPPMLQGPNIIAPSRMQVDSSDPQSPSVDHMARLLGMLKTANAQSAPAQPSLPSTPNVPMRSAPVEAVSPSSGSRFLAAMLHADKTKVAASPPLQPATREMAESMTPQHSSNQLNNRQAHAPPSHVSMQHPGATIPEHGGIRAMDSYQASARPSGPSGVEPNAHRPMALPPNGLHPLREMDAPSAGFNVLHTRPPNMDMLPMPPNVHQHHQPLMTRPNINEPTAAGYGQVPFWQLATELPRGMGPNHPMHIPGPPYPPINMPPPGYGPYQQQPFMPGPGLPQMPPLPPMLFNGAMPPAPPQHSMTPDAMSSNLMALLQNRPQA